MKNNAKLAVMAVVLLWLAPRVSALSVMLPAPDVNFPKGYDQARAGQILAILRDPLLKYQDGITSYWPPEWGTTLVYDGDTAALNSMLARLAKIPGVHVALSFTRGPVATTRDGRSGNWEVKYGQTTPNTLHVVVNLKAAGIDVEKLLLPQWGDGPEETPSANGPEAKMPSETHRPLREKIVREH